MKKILSVLLAVMLASVSFAQVQNMRAFSRANASVLPVEKKARPESAVKKALPADARQVSRNAAKAVYDVVCTSYSARYYEEDNDSYIVLGNSDYSFRFDVVLDGTDTALTIGQTYYLSQMIADYTYGKSYIAQANIIYAEASITHYKTSDGRDHIVANVTDEDGNVYNIEYTQPLPQSYDVICTRYSARYYAETNDSYVVVGNDDFAFSFDIFLSGSDTNVTIGHTYYLSDMDEEWSYGWDYGQDAEIVYAAASFTHYKTDAGLDHIVAVVTDVNGNVYNIEYGEIVALDTITIAMGGVEFIDYGDLGDGRHDWYFYGANADSSYQVQVNYYSVDPVGSFTIADCYAYYTSIFVNHSDIYDFLSGNFDVTETESGYRLEGYLLAEDRHCYHVIMTEGTVGINNANAVEVRLYPNPATDKLNVLGEGIQKVEVLDINGRVVMSRNVAGQLNIGQLSKGVYMVRTITDNGVNVKRIVKE